MAKIAIIGAPSCRKTTTAEQLKIRLKTAMYNVEIAPEYARSYIRNFGSIESPIEQLTILHGQKEMEHQLETIHELVICDSAQFLGYVYCTTFPNMNHKEYNVKEMLHKMCMDSVDEYAYIFLAPLTGEGIIKDGVRIQDDHAQENIDAKIRAMLTLEDIPYIELPNSSVDGKVEFIINYLCNKVSFLKAEKFYPQPAKPKAVDEILHMPTSNSQSLMI
jgi:nicotinamide riboside kinase